MGALLHQVEGFACAPGGVDGDHDWLAVAGVEDVTEYLLLLVASAATVQTDLSHKRKPRKELTKHFWVVLRTRSRDRWVDADTPGKTAVVAVHDKSCLGETAGNREDVRVTESGELAVSHVWCDVGMAVQSRESVLAIAHGSSNIASSSSPR